MSKQFTFLIFLFFSISASAQYQSQYAHFMFNKMEYNPGYTGNTEMMTLSAIYRHQWQGIEGAPRTATLFGHTPFSNNRGGIGLSLISDRIGMTYATQAKINYAYRIKMKDASTLSVGLNLSYEHTRLNWSKAQIIDFIDTDLPMGLPSQSNMNFGVGLYYQTKKYYLGASAPYLLKNSLYNTTLTQVTNFQRYRHFYLMGGTIFSLGKTIFKPAILVSYVPNAPFEIDLNAHFLFAKRIWVGVSYRLNDAVSGLVQFQTTQQLKLGIAYGYSLTAIRQYNVGSFEVMAEYVFSFDKENVNNIRYF